MRSVPKDQKSTVIPTASLLRSPQLWSTHTQRAPRQQMGKATMWWEDLQRRLRPLLGLRLIRSKHKPEIISLALIRRVVLRTSALILLCSLRRGSSREDSSNSNSSSNSGGKSSGMYVWVWRFAHPHLHRFTKDQWIGVKENRWMMVRDDFTALPVWLHLTCRRERVALYYSVTSGSEGCSYRDPDWHRNTAHKSDCSAGMI